MIRHFSIYSRGMKKRVKKTFITLIGGIVLIAGIIMIPYPGPGWLTVFAGLGILSTEYTWAKRLLRYAKKKYDSWEEWVNNQSVLIKSLLWILTAVVVVVTIWLLNGYGFFNHLLNLGWDWVDSPLPMFHTVK
jgi:uncharacterized protein (TIGR02611 family)